MMMRFVILTHDFPFLHWDLMLETAGSNILRTWRLLAEPGSAKEIQAESLPDHRREYLDYEGPVSRGRGSVVRWDAGVYEANTDEKTALRLSLSGNKLRGEFALVGRNGSLWWQQLAGESAKSDG